MLLCPNPRWSVAEALEAHVLGRRVALSGDWEGTEEPGQGWRGQANLKRKAKEELKKRWSCRQSWGHKVWVAFLSHPLLQPRSSPSCAELHVFAVTLTCAQLPRMACPHPSPPCELFLACFLVKELGTAQAVSRLQLAGTAVAGCDFSFRPRAYSCGPVTRREIHLWVTEEH